MIVAKSIKMILEAIDHEQYTTGKPTSISAEKVCHVTQEAVQMLQ